MKWFQKVLGWVKTVSEAIKKAVSYVKGLLAEESNKENALASFTVSSAVTIVLSTIGMFWSMILGIAGSAAICLYKCTRCESDKDFPVCVSYGLGAGATLLCVLIALIL